MGKMIRITAALNTDVIHVKAPFNNGFNRSLTNVFEVGDEVFFNGELMCWDIQGIEHLETVESIVDFHFPNSLVNYQEIDDDEN